VVIRPGYTRETAIKAMDEQLKRAGARVLGIVANRIPTNLQDYYGGQLYVSPYYSGRYFEQPKKPLTAWEKFMAVIGLNPKPKPVRKAAPAALQTPGSTVETPTGSKKPAE
jgi:Mrp family chromosome partitioning ATPase